MDYVVHNLIIMFTRPAPAGKCQAFLTAFMKKVVNTPIKSIKTRSLVDRVEMNLIEYFIDNKLRRVMLYQKNWNW